MPETQDKLVGREVAGYLLQEVLGRGGAGQVYRAVEKSSGRLVAFKVLEPGLFPSEEFQKRFEREMQVCQAIKHPHILPIYSWGQVGDGRYIVMKLVQGHTLSELRDDPSTTNRMLFTYLQQVADALGAMHAQQIVHRDLKPSNIMIEQGHAFLLDFGLARHVRGDTISSPKFILGTPMYMSPEQVRGDRLSPSCDVFAMGSMIYEMLSLKQPFCYDIPTAEYGKHLRTLTILERIIAGEYPALHRWNRGIPQQVEKMVHTCLQTDPNKRLKDGARLSAEMKSLLDDPTLQGYWALRPSVTNNEELSTVEVLPTPKGMSPNPKLNVVVPPTMATTAEIAPGRDAANRIYWVAGLICAVAVLAAFSGILVPRFIKSDYDKMVIQAEQMEMTGKLDDAIAMYGKAIEKEPANFTAYWRRGRIYVRVGQQKLSGQYVALARGAFQKASADLQSALQFAAAAWPDRPQCQDMKSWVDKQLAELK